LQVRDQLGDRLAVGSSAEAGEAAFDARPIASPPRVHRVHRRVAEGMGRRHNWIQLVKFAAVGGVGYVINLIVYEAARSGLGVHYIGAAVIAFAFAVTNNFMLNRHWTFEARDGHAGFQAARFFTVSLAALVFNLIVLKLLVTQGGMAKFPAQAIAVIAATPMNFVGNKLWSFGR
jgi:dolichol-phosphate mannosyltransferase